jgi:hypothetical protein
MRPLPILTALLVHETEDYMHFRLTDIRFPYVTTFVPEGRRKARTAVVGATARSALRCVDLEEVRIAFRISYTERDAWPFLNARKENTGSQAGYLRRATTLTLIEYAGAIWWPIGLDSGFCYPGPLATDAECIEWMSSGYAFWYREGTSSPHSRNAIASARGSVENGHDAALADVLRQVDENILVCGTQWYVRGGVPIFVKRPYRTGKVWEIDVADPGPDRIIGAAGAFTASTRNSALNNEAFRSNPVWSALQAKTATREVHRLQRGIPAIEVLMPELVTDRRAAVRIDAMLSQALRMFEEPFSTRWDDEAAAEHRENLAKATRTTGDDDDITIRRARALKVFFAAQVSDGDCSQLTELRSTFRSFLDECASSQPALFGSINESSEPLSWEEEEALQQLAGVVDSAGPG